jgi:hypothetical protein
MIDIPEVNAISNEPVSQLELKPRPSFGIIIAPMHGVTDTGQPLRIHPANRTNAMISLSNNPPHTRRAGTN